MSKNKKTYFVYPFGRGTIDGGLRGIHVLPISQ